ncbi:MAG: alpha/beta fold hydrolase [Myxococcaceae bacterium]|nr:alpha/beta fold hydrolase [Myxococcaceae bacterium]
MLLLFASGCARTLYGRGEPLLPWPVDAEGVRTELRGEGRVFRSETVTASSPTVVFLHGFATTPAQYGHTLEQLAARGFVVWAPALPDYWLGRVGYHGVVLAAAQAAYAEAAADARARGAGPPMLVGHSMGGGAALLVAAGHNVPVVLWAPVRLDLPLPEPAPPSLVLLADHDCIAGDQPKQLVAALRPGPETAVISGNHVGFTDRTGEQFDCDSPVTRDVQRAEALRLTVEYLSRP